MKMINCIILLIIVNSWACVKPSPITPDPPIPHDTTVIVKDPVLEIMWTTRLDFEKEIVNLNDGQQYKERYLFTGDFDSPPTIMAFNKVTGDKDWTYIHEGVVDGEIDISTVVDNVYIGLCSQGIVGIDLDERKTLWEIDFRMLNFYRGASNVVFGNHLYHEVKKNGTGLNSTSQAILKINIYTGVFEEVFEDVNDVQGLKTLSPPAFWTSPETGKTLMVFNEYPDAELPPESASQNIMAIDVETMEIVWKIEDFTEKFYSNSLHPPILYNDIIITGGDWSIYAFDVRTGEQLWRTQIPDYDKFGIFASTNHLIYDDRLYVNGTGPTLTCINPMDGNILWNSTDAPNCTDNMVYYEKEDLLVFTSWGYGSVMVLDALTGETIHRERPYEESSYNNDVVYDPVRDMFFTSTYKHAIGFTIHKQ